MQRLSFILILILLASCVAKKKAAEFDTQPIWLKQKPVESGYYIGIGSAKKVGTPKEFKEQARRDAFADLAESISVQVSSTSVLHTIESKHGLTETYDQKIEVSTDDYLEGFEPVDFFENEQSYWVYYRIKESTYWEKKATKKQEAIDLAKSKYFSGQLEQEANNPKEAVTFYLQGLEAIFPYLNEETFSDFHGNKIDVGNELYSSLSQVLLALNIKSELGEMNAKWGDDMQEHIYFMLLFNNAPVQGIPVQYQFTGGYLKRDTDNSDEKGMVSLEPGRIISKKSREKIIASINFEEIASKAVDNLFIRGLVKDFEAPSASVNIIIEPRTLSIVLPQGKCSPEQCNAIIKEFNRVVTDAGYQVKVDEATDYGFKLNYDYSNGESAGGLFSVYLSGNLIITDKTNKEIWNKKIREIKAVAEDRDAARGKAFAELLNNLSRIYFKEGITYLN
jgi:hypothetical protein